MHLTRRSVHQRILSDPPSIFRYLSTRRVALTEAGTSYAAELRDVLLRLEAADARVQNRTTEPEGLLRVTMPTAFGRVCVIPHLAQLMRRHPKLRLELDLSDRYVDLPESGFDVAIRLAAPGSVAMRAGTKFEQDDKYLVGPGSVLIHPGDIPHYLWTGPRGVVLQIMGIGPGVGIDYVNPPDDPPNQATATK